MSTQRRKAQPLAQYLRGVIQLFQGDPKTRISDEWWCETCHYVLVAEFDGARQAIENRGMPLHMAQCKCSDNERRARRQRTEDYRASGLPSSRNTFENFRPRPGTEEAYATTRQYAAEKLSPVLVLLGGVGTGKTHLAEAVGNQMMGIGNLVRYAQASSMLREMYARMNSATETLSDYIEDLMTARLLIIDDIGTGQPTEWAQGQILNLIDNRIQQGRWLLVTSNLTTYEATEAKLGTRIADRLFDVTSGTVGQVILDCESYRHWKEVIV